MHALVALHTGIDRLNEFIGRITAWCIVVAIVVSAVNAIARKFGYSSNSWLELQWYLFGAVFMLCAGWTLRCNEHVRVDVLWNMFSERTRAWIDFIGYVCVLLPFVLIMVWLSWPYLMTAWQTGEHSGQSGGLLIWPARAIIVAGFSLLGLQALSELIKCVLTLVNHEAYVSSDPQEPTGDMMPLNPGYK